MRRPNGFWPDLITLALRHMGGEAELRDIAEWIQRKVDLTERERADSNYQKHPRYVHIVRSTARRMYSLGLLERVSHGRYRLTGRNDAPPSPHGSPPGHPRGLRRQPRRRDHDGPGGHRLRLHGRTMTRPRRFWLDTITRAICRMDGEADLRDITEWIERKVYLTEHELEDGYDGRPRYAHSVRTIASLMARRGLLEREGRGLYRLPEEGMTHKLRKNCTVQLARLVDKTSGASRERWARAGLQTPRRQLAGEVLTVRELLGLGLSIADIRWEIGYRKNWRHIL